MQIYLHGSLLSSVGLCIKAVPAAATSPIHGLWFPSGQFHRTLFQTVAQYEKVALCSHCEIRRCDFFAKWLISSNLYYLYCKAWKTKQTKARLQNVPEKAQDPWGSMAFPSGFGPWKVTGLDCFIFSSHLKDHMLLLCLTLAEKRWELLRVGGLFLPPGANIQFMSGSTCWTRQENSINGECGGQQDLLKSGD